ncbi:hypothetical protein LTR10_014434 [Elasticomyces elasticus]|uniref:Uncharacterized protein n=1 Tax=Exophiala sideris TaxID=1016849 RepID=A0ABR0J092_9EURO|nr:hypothetical protein LTR10_014434 [Elasticomyces elasticus]KAK5023652.1 hypothetical protein LTS07_009160 [Exophiala sideris]KAK5029652.1 hypothetical protein LTR13_008572 [Exophiala sideris]KAK5053441.1 hypothetical protein LTR69_009399 [Exophiala sideris]KAK5179199.1 hypothetical protein LTR44_008353 [Eurotiomycetes sp. CCFEE 6388]
MPKAWNAFKRRAAQSSTSFMSYGRKEPAIETTTELNQGRVHTWNSIWLSRPALGVIATVFTVLAVALLLLWRLNEQEGGFTLITSNHYSWTYGPTGILVIVVAFWRQVDYHCKLIAPWTALKKEQRTASQNLLLDYVSPLQIASLTKSISSRHYNVAVGIIGFLVLKLIVLTSTGLFVTVSTPVYQDNVNLIQMKTFNGRLASQSPPPTLNDSSLLYTAYGILSRGLEYPLGTYEGLSYETFEPETASALDSMAITTTVNALIPAFECQVAPVTVNLQTANTTDLHPNDFLQLQFPECQLLQNGNGTPVYALNPQLFACPPRQLSPLVQRISCFNETDAATADNWQLLTLVDMRYNQTLSSSGQSHVLGDSVETSSWLTTVNRITGIACRSTYTLERVNVTYDYSRNPVNITVKRLEYGANHTLDGLSDFDVGTWFTAALLSSADMFGNIVFDSYDEEYPNTMFEMMAQVAGGGYEALLDVNTMIQSAETVFKQVAVQFLNKHMAQAVKTPLGGQAYYVQERLQVNNVSLWLMFSGFLLMTIITAFIMIRPGTYVTPRNPEPLISAALLSNASPELDNLLTELGEAYQGRLEAALEKREFASITSSDGTSARGFAISVSESSTHLPMTKQDPGAAWWKPISSRRAFVTVTLLLPPTIIAMLEVLQRISDNESGITTVSAESSLSSKALTRYLPALVMLLSATLFNSVDFTIAVLAPYNALKSGARSAESTIMCTIVGLMPPAALWVSIRHHYWGATFSSIAALLGSVLTIVSSGLYTIDFVPVVSSMSIQRTDVFTPTWTNSVLHDSGAAVLTSLSEGSNLTYPQFTFDGLALPGLQLVGGQSKTFVDGHASLAVQLPGVRASLNCTLLDSSQFNVSTFYNPESGPSAFVSASAPLPLACPYGGSGGNLTTMDFEQTIQLPFTTNSSFVAKMLDIHVGPFDPILASSSGEIAPTTQKDNPPGCPSLAFIYGHVDVNNMSQTVVTTMTCYQQMEQITVDTTLALPDLAISQNSPPVADESTSRLLASGSGGETALPYRLEVHMDNELSIFNQTQYDSTDISQATVDGFFQGVLFGKYPIPQTWLADSARVTEVMSAIQAFYRRYMAQAISANMRVATPAADAELINGTVTTPQGVLRVRQNKPSKLVLQILVGVMFVCGVLAVSLSSLREVVPYNPCTIAGVIALWAGSRFTAAENAETGGCTDNEVRVHDGERPEMPKEAMFMSNKELLRSGAFDGWNFRLGWWDLKDGSRRYGIDAVRKKAEWRDW